MSAARRGNLSLLKKKVNKYDEEAEIWKALAAGNVKPANDSSTLRGVVKDLIDDRRRR